MGGGGGGGTLLEALLGSVKIEKVKTADDHAFNMLSAVILTFSPIYV